MKHMPIAVAALFLAGVLLTPSLGGTLNSRELDSIRAAGWNSDFVFCTWMKDGDPPAASDCNTCVALNGGGSVNCTQSQTSASLCVSKESTTGCTRCRNGTESCPGNVQTFTSNNCTGVFVSNTDCKVRNWTSGEARGSCPEDLTKTPPVMAKTSCP